jgi:nucleotide-binding universal stress UspA family protein
MIRQLLVTVSDDPSALAGARFVGSFFKNKSGMRLTLFYTGISPQKNLRSRREFNLGEQQQRAREERGNRALEQARSILLHAGFTEKQVEAKLKLGSGATASDIILEAERGLYDAVVLGRRGVSWLEEALGESVTKDLLEETLHFPFWICRQPDIERMNVLLCVDGSAPSIRMADHVGFMLEQQPEQHVTLLTIKRKDDQDAQTIFDECRASLEGHNVTGKRVHTMVAKEQNVAQTILKIAGEQRFAVVAMGRTGAGGGLLSRLFMGSASSVLFNQLEGAVLWVSH